MAAKLFISGYRYLANDDSVRFMQCPKVPGVYYETIEMSYQSDQSKEFPEYCHFIEIKAEAACSLAFGKDPTAVAEIHPIDPGERLWYGVDPGHRLAVVLR